jgi:hypothetical protein
MRDDITMADIYDVEMGFCRTVGCEHSKAEALLRCQEGDDIEDFKVRLDDDGLCLACWRDGRDYYETLAAHGPGRL